MKLELDHNQHYFIAFSGGIDSTVLSHLTKDAGLDVTLIHVNHGLQAAANDFEAHCESSADQMGLTLILKTLDTKPQKGDSLEAFAREARYKVLSEVVQEGILLVGQHADDQAESVLLQLLRGAGPAGLSAMAYEKTIDKMTVLRPLLQYTRAEIEAYAKSQQLKWMDDPTNSDARFKRNALRHEVLPVLQKHFPDYVKTMSRSAELCAEANDFIESWVAVNLPQFLGEEQSLLVKDKAFNALPLTQRNYLIRGWLSLFGVRALNRKHLSEIHKVIHAEHWAQAVFKVGDVVLRRSKTGLWVDSNHSTKF